MNGSCIFLRLFLQTQRFSFAPGNGEFLLLAAFDVAASSSESAEKELLGQACANPFGGADRKISEDHPGTTIGSGIVKVREGGRCQIATHA